MVSFPSQNHRTHLQLSRTHGLHHDHFLVYIKERLLWRIDQNERRVLWFLINNPKSLHEIRTKRIKNTSLIRLSRLGRDIEDNAVVIVLERIIATSDSKAGLPTATGPLSPAVHARRSYAKTPFPWRVSRETGAISESSREAAAAERPVAAAVSVGVTLFSQRCV